MKQVFIKKAQHARLFLFFAGWGADEHLFNYPVAEGYDYLLCFDYRTLDFDYALLDGYQSIHLAAWSMGVWAASCIFSGKDYPWESLVAINGTPCPVHDCYGIPEAVFGGTVLHFSEQTLVRFRRRMCGSAEEVKLFLAHQPYRSLDELHEELALLYQEVKREVCLYWLGVKQLSGCVTTSFRRSVSSVIGKGKPTLFCWIWGIIRMPSSLRI